MEIKVFTDPDKIVKEIHIVDAGGNLIKKLVLNEDISDVLFLTHQAGQNQEPIRFFKTDDMGKLQELIIDKMH